MLRKVLQTVVISVGVAGLAACSSTGTGANAGGNGVTTSGLGASGSDMSMVPGANQTYYFDFDKSDVHSSDMPSIKVQAQYLISHPNASVLLEGNTDIRGSREYNIALGQRRANAVASVLQLDGVNKSQIQTISYGAEKPVALGNTEDDYAKNRRDDLVYQSK